MELYTKQLTPNQVFKNYKELCMFLGEEPKKANSKKSQLKEWERYFAFTKNGQKIIITEIYDSPKDKVDNRINNGGYNTKNIQSVMDYILSNFDEDKFMGKYMTISNWSTKVFHLLNADVCNIVYEDDEIISKYCKEHNISDIQFFKQYVGIVKYVVKKLLVSSFNTLHKRGCIEMYEGYKFAYDGENRYGQSCVKYIGTSSLNEMVDEMERTICDLMKEKYFPDRKIKGKQLLHYLQQECNKELFQEYIATRKQYMNENDDFLSLLNDDIMSNGDYGLDGEYTQVNNYYPAYEICGFDRKDFVKVDNKQEVFGVIKRLALKQMLYIKVYDIEIARYERTYADECYRDEMKKINNLILDGVIEEVNRDEIIEESFNDDMEYYFTEIIVPMMECI